MLTSDAFGVLLKTLEEPPMHIIFILVTTEYDKLPITIRSRCQTFRLKKSTFQDTMKLLTKISHSEKLCIEKDMLESIAYKSSGSFRESVVMLQSLEIMKEEEMEQVLNYETTKYFNLLYNAMVNHTSIPFITYLLDKGLYSGSFMNAFIRYIVLQNKKNSLEMAKVFFEETAKVSYLLEEAPFIFFVLRMLENVQQ